MSFAQRLFLAFAVLSGRLIPPDTKEVTMELERVKAQVASLEAALSRATDSKSADATTIAGQAQKINDQTGQIGDLTQQLTDAEGQIVELLQPAVDAANALAPDPAA